MRRLTLLLFLAVAGAAAQSPKIAVIGGPRPLWPEVLQQLEQRFPSVVANWEFRLPQDKHDVALVFAYYPTPEELTSYQLLSAGQSLGFPVELEWKRAVNAAASARASAYLDEGGVENGVRLLVYLYSLVHPDAPSPEPPLSRPRSGIYHPDVPETFAGFATYRNWWRARNPGRDAKAVAIPFFSTWLRNRDLAAIDATIREVEKRGLMPVAGFGYPMEMLSPILTHEGQFQPGVVIALQGTSSSPKDVETYNAWGVPVLNGLVTRETAEEWRANKKGLPPDRMAAHLSFPERAGMTAPTLVATTETSPQGIQTAQPVASGMAAIVDRAQRMLALQDKPASDKRVALLYYNNPPGKGNIGASYLQVFPSLQNILQSLRQAGYIFEGPLPDEQKLRQLLTVKGRNLEVWSAGEAREKAANREMTLWPVAAYRRYYDALPPRFRQQVEASWGTPESSTLMSVDCPSGRCFLLPVMGSGNVLLGAQPLRTTFEQASDPGHELTTPPPHQYIAFYFWLRHEWKADAVVHLGRHGTLEWLPGKQTALSDEDAPFLLLRDLPNFNVYVMDGGGEAIQAKRRAQATLISHLTPMIWRTGGREDLETLHVSFHELMDRGESLAPALAAEHEKVTRAEVKRLGLDKQLGIDLSGSLKQMAPALHQFLHHIEDAPLPAGLPIFGQSPSDTRLEQAVEAYLFSAFAPELHDEVEPEVSKWAAAFLRGDRPSTENMREAIATVLTRMSRELPEWIESLRNSGRAEMQGLLAALQGKHVPSRPLGDPLRKPEALPTGANLHAVDSARIPTPVAWRVGQQMAKDFIEKYRSTHQQSPRRVSLVLWYGETERHQGAMESMALALLGVRPVWNQRGIVDNLELIPAAELGRARVDIVITASGIYRDGLPEKLQLLDRAVRLAATADDGVIAANDRQLASTLEAKGLAAAEAKRQSEIRVFSAKPGEYGVGVQYLVEKSGGNDTPEKIAELYTANMGYGYSAGEWGVASHAALKGNLRTVDAVQFSRSSNLYGSLDNDDTYQYVGGLRTAAEVESGKAPEVMLHNLRQAGTSQIASLREWLAVELHSRQLNPKWIEEMRNSGYAGARQINREIEHLYGFQKTTPEHLSRATWQTVMDVFVKDKYKLGLQSFFQQQNPHARQSILARLVEVDRQGIHRFSARDRRQLLREYVKSVHHDGPACAAIDCGGSVLRSHVSEALQSEGRLTEAAQLDKAYEKELGPGPGINPRLPAGKPETAEPRLSNTYTLAGIRQIGKYMVTWVDRVVALDKHKIVEAAKAIPVWLWLGVGFAYLAIMLVRMRMQTKARVQSLSLSR